MRTLAKECEGTPSFESVELENHNLENSIIKLRFHFWRNSVNDAQAEGTLTNWFDWQTNELHVINKNIQSLGFNGNIGSR